MLRPLVVLTLSIVALTLSGCWSQIASLGGSDKPRMQDSIDDLRLEVAELKHTLHTHQVDMQILDEKISASQIKNKGSSEEKIKWLGDKMSQLEARFSAIQHLQDSFLKDLRTLRDSTTANNIAVSEQKERFALLEQTVAQQSQKMENIKELKTTLSSIKKVMSDNSPVVMTTYKVRPGDTLEKIAKQTAMTLEELRKLNNLTSDQIRIGQTLKILHDQHNQ